MEEAEGFVSTLARVASTRHGPRRFSWYLDPREPLMRPAGLSPRTARRYCIYGRCQT